MRDRIRSSRFGLLAVALSIAASCDTTTAYTRPIRERRDKIMTLLQTMLEEKGYTVIEADKVAATLETGWKDHSYFPESVTENETFRMARIRVNCRIEDVGPLEYVVAFSTIVQKGTRNPTSTGDEKKEWSSVTSDPEEEEKLVTLFHMKLGLLRMRED